MKVSVNLLLALYGCSALSLFRGSTRSLRSSNRSSSSNEDRNPDNVKRKVVGNIRIQENKTLYDPEPEKSNRKISSVHSVVSDKVIEFKNYTDSNKMNEAFDTFTSEIEAKRSELDERESRIATQRTILEGRESILIEDEANYEKRMKEEEERTRYAMEMKKYHARQMDSLVQREEEIARQEALLSIHVKEASASAVVANPSELEAAGKDNHSSKKSKEKSDDEKKKKKKKSKHSDDEDEEKKKKKKKKSKHSDDEDEEKKKKKKKKSKHSDDETEEEEKKERRRKRKEEKKAKHHHHHDEEENSEKPISKNNEISFSIGNGALIIDGAAQTAN
ncbi:hypothetical protein ENBRE01_2178 [Enteropsectra breve]|nr:hypothetical protein ENBRE01_2178 [Enteropsectra breve]